MAQLLRRFKIGEDFSKEDYEKWLEQLTWWIGSRMPNIQDSAAHAKTVIRAALNGSKLDGQPWPGVSNDFYKRIKQLVGFDLEKGIGIREPSPTIRMVSKEHTKSKTTVLPPIDLEKTMQFRQEYVNDLITKYPHLDTPVYKPKVEELAETIAKSRMISTDFMTASGAALEKLSKIRESLHKQIGELMEFLEISPKQRVTKLLDSKNADVGSLVARLESYAEYWSEYERIDALRELIQLYRMLQSSRPDGTKQLNDWEVWHMTRCKPMTFTCRHGETYELIDGFTPEEIEAALLQAEKIYGFGLKGITEQVPEEHKEVDVLEETDFETFDETLNPEDTDTDEV